MSVVGGETPLPGGLDARKAGGNMMRIGSLVLVGTVLMLCAGCSAMGPRAVGSFQSVDLGKDLDEGALSRYRTETENSGPQNCEGHVVMLERTNWWPLGLVAYWNRGTVRAVHSPGGYHYAVSKTLGLGPLCALFVSKEETIYGGDGKRQHYMAMGSVGFGHVAMYHVMGMPMGEGHWMQHWSAGLAHHLLNVGEEHGKVSVSLFSGPNPIGIGD